MDAFLPTYPQKNLMQNVRGRKKYPASTYPRKKNHCELSGWKKIHAHTKSLAHPPTPPTPPPSKKIKMVGP